MASASRRPLKLNLRNRGDSCSNLSAVDLEMSLPSKSSFRKDGCLARILHFLHTGATRWQRSLTLSRENIWSISSGGRSMMFVRELRNFLPVFILLVFRTCFLRMLRIVILTFASVPVNSPFSRLRFIFSSEQLGRNYCYKAVWLDTSVEHLEPVATNSYSAVANLHSRQITWAHAVCLIRSLQFSLPAKGFRFSIYNPWRDHIESTASSSSYIVVASCCVTIGSLVYRAITMQQTMFTQSCHRNNIK
jgi:hypothetical protein